MPEQPDTVTASRAPVAAKPFRFCTSRVLQESTGLRAAKLPTLAKLIRTVPAASIYYHTHYFLLQHQYLTPEPTNDFAYWVREVLGEEPLGELLASIDTMEYSNLEDLRRVLGRTIEEYLASRPLARLKFVSSGEEFFFLKLVHVVLPTPHVVSTLEEFARALEQVSVGSLYFHMFDARLRLGRPTNDFSLWFDEQLGLKGFAEQVSRLDPYVHTLDALRTILLTLVRQELNR